jgi:ABC-type branched-subunit amino acid transport system substrate-binding protein
MFQSCDRWEKKLATTCIGQFSLRERQKLFRHMQTCRACFDMYTEYLMVDTSLQHYFKDKPVPLPMSESRQPTPTFSSQDRVAARSFLKSWPHWRQDPSWVLVGLATLLGLLSFALNQVISPAPGANATLALSLMLAPIGGMLFFRAISASPMSAGGGKLTVIAHSSPEKIGTTADAREMISAIPSLREDLPLGLERGKRSVGQSYRSRWLNLKVLLTLLLVLLAVGASSLGLLLRPSTSSNVTVLSTGTRVFDSDRQNAGLKRQAAQALAKGDVMDAEKLWKQAVLVDSGDAEARIYLEDQQVLNTHRPYITLVIGTMFLKGYISGGRDDLQGAYMAQKQWNEQAKKSGQMLLRLIIAAGSDETSPATVAQQIVQTAQQDPTIKGVLGWPTSSGAMTTVPILTAAHLPMISPTASSDALARFPYFFQIAPSNRDQAAVAAAYVQQVLHANRIVLFVDPHDSYSRNLYDDFASHFTGSGSTLIKEQYQIGQPAGLPNLVAQALQAKPDLIFFAGYASDVSVILKNLPPCSPGQCPLVMGGDGLYLQGDYSVTALANYSRLRITTPAYPDLGGASNSQEALFLQTYAQVFDPSKQYQAGTYGYNQPEGHTILSYEGVEVFLHTIRTLLASGKTHFSPDNLQHALKQIDHSHPIQGIRGPIAFGPDGSSLFGQEQVIVLEGEKGGGVHRVYP